MKSLVKKRAHSRSGHSQARGRAGHAPYVYLDAVKAYERAANHADAACAHLEDLKERQARELATAVRHVDETTQALEAARSWEEKARARLNETLRGADRV